MAGKSTKSWQERFWRFVDRSQFSPGGCWMWTGGNNGKYGVMGVGGKNGVQRYAHRLSWTMDNGDIPDGLHVLHRCDNPPCVNPAHLFIGTVRDNALDKSRKGRHWMQLNGDKSAADANPNAVLDWVRVHEIRRLHSAGASAKGLGKTFGVGRTTIGHIVHRRTWK